MSEAFNPREGLTEEQAAAFDALRRLVASGRLSDDAAFIARVGGSGTPEDDGIVESDQTTRVLTDLVRCSGFAQRERERDVNYFIIGL